LLLDLLISIDSDRITVLTYFKSSIGLGSIIGVLDNPAL